jgi:hypothetical protein
MRSIGAACFLTLTFWIAMSASSAASAICWIDHIAKANGGVDVYFVPKAVLRIVVNNSDGSPVQFTSADGAVRDESGHERNHLFVKDGAEFSASQLAHDSCTYKVVAYETVSRVTAKASMRLPGLPPSFATQTIATDGTVSQPASASASP